MLMSWSWLTIRGCFYHCCSFSLIHFLYTDYVNKLAFRVVTPSIDELTETCQGIKHKYFHVFSNKHSLIGLGPSLKIQNTTLPSSLVSNHWKWRIIKEGWRKKNVGGYSPNTQARQHPCTCTMLRSVITVRSRNVHVFRKLLLASNRERKDEHSGQIPGAEMGEPR